MFKLEKHKPETQLLCLYLSYGTCTLKVYLLKVKSQRNRAEPWCWGHSPGCVGRMCKPQTFSFSQHKRRDEMIKYDMMWSYSGFSGWEPDQVFTQDKETKKRHLLEHFPTLVNKRVWLPITATTSEKNVLLESKHVNWVLFCWESDHI